ncbi:transcription factor bHLH71 [Impatiens glandulifera]|uniref:transcription factor bHLH71 n=1 Tax=Impatiens glandulifera TaxID=253017 RepID=UPI001FB1186D|nr:transcription factor bHLH71 [Impatiens glandulifera]
MAVEAISSSSTDLFNFIIYDTISAAPFSSTTAFSDKEPPLMPPHLPLHQPPSSSDVQQGRKKRVRRKPKVCKNKEEAETQRMTHITVERNRRKLMNDHLCLLRSLMPESYVQKGDQASIVGGAIEYVKELEHHLQALEAQKLIFLRKLNQPTYPLLSIGEGTNNVIKEDLEIDQLKQQPFAQFFECPQYKQSQIDKFSSKCKASVADIEVTLIQTHANLRILAKKCHRIQLSKMVSSFQALNLAILHLNLTTFESLVLYSISVKVEEGCHFTSADDIADAVHSMLRMFEIETI